MMTFDEVMRVRTANTPGIFARYAQAVANVGGLLEEIETIQIGKYFCIRDVTVALSSEDMREALYSAVQALDGIEVIESIDRVFELHEGGKIACRATRPIEKASMLRSIYTPGVARVCEAIKEEPALAVRYTSIGSTVGVFTNGTRVLGLGNIGVEASMPVMEGKAALYSELIGLSAVPILVDTRDVDEFVETVVRVSKTFGGVHLEDIESPACFEIERQLDQRLNVPVMHDDRHGTAVAALAGLLKACETVNRSLHDMKVAQIGLGAAGAGIAELLLAYGVKNLMAVDRRPENVARIAGARATDFEEALATADVVVLTTGVPGLLKPEQVRKGQIIFALSNPIPEIQPKVAMEAGARFATDGAHVNNLLGFPGMFKGAMETGSPRISNAMKIAAARVIADRAPDDDMMPDPLDRELHKAVARAVKEAALNER